MKVVLIFFASIFLLSCSATNNKSVDELWSSAVESREEDDLRTSISMFKLIIEKFPKSEHSPRAQFQIADIYLNDVKDYLFAIQEFEILINDYSNHILAKKSFFMVAYILNNYLNEYSRAIDKYSQFLDKYPNDELVPSVEFELEGLRKYENTIDSLNNI